MIPSKCQSLQFIKKTIHGLQIKHNRAALRGAWKILQHENLASKSVGTVWCCRIRRVQHCRCLQWSADSISEVRLSWWQYPTQSTIDAPKKCQHCACLTCIWDKQQIICRWFRVLLDSLHFSYLPGSYPTQHIQSWQDWESALTALAHRHFVRTP